jgi:hypothetical protein
MSSLSECSALYLQDPLGFALDCFEPGTLDLDQWQRQFLSDLGEEVKKRGFKPWDPNPVAPVRMAVASGHGIGKSTLGAILFWWIMCTRPDCKIRVTANTYTQLEVTTWAEIKKWGGRCLFREWFEIGAAMIVHKERPKKDSWWGVPITSSDNNSEAFAGQHNRESSSVFLFDESSLIPDVIWEVADNGLTDGEPFWFALGNPTRNTGKFYDACFGGWQDRWLARSVNSMDCKFPNHEKHQQDIDDHGWDSDYVKVRIRGLPPAQAEDQLISRELIEGAQKRDVTTLADDPLIAGVDVPDGGSGWFVVRFRRGLDARPGQRVPSPVRIAGSKTDRPAMIAKCAQILTESHPDRRVSAMFVDMGFGAAIVERLRAWNYDNVFEVNFGAKSPDPAYGNMRAYMWAKEMKDWLSRGAISPEDKKLASDLSAPGFKHRLGGDGALLLESKDEMRRRGIASPDDGDAFALTFAMPSAQFVEQPRATPSPRPRGEKRDAWMG